MNSFEKYVFDSCPNGIEYVELSKIATFQNGFAFKSSLFRDEGKPILRITNIQDGKLADEGYAFFDENDYSENLANYEVKKGDIVVAMSGATTGKVGYNFSDTTYYLNQRVGLFRINEDVVNRKYFYYWLTSQSEKILEVSTGSGAQPNLSSAKMMTFEIPIPTMEIQEHIVDILDTFVNMKNSLNLELELRKKQYLFYALKLLNFGDDVRKEKIGTVCNVEKGKTPIQKANPGEYPLVATTEERQSCDNYQFDCKAVCLPLISSKGHGVASISRVYYQEGKFALGNILCAIIPKNDAEINAKFLRYYLFLKKDILLVPLMRGGANVSLTTDSLKGVEIPIPSIDEQNKIVTVLEQLDRICNNAGEGIPFEISLREKQYNYYLDKIFKFDF